MDERVSPAQLIDALYDPQQCEWCRLPLPAGLRRCAILRSQTGLCLLFNIVAMDLNSWGLRSAEESVGLELVRAQGAPAIDQSHEVGTV